MHTHEQKSKHILKFFMIWSKTDIYTCCTASQIWAMTCEDLPRSAMVPPLTGVFSLSFFRLTTRGGDTFKGFREEMLIYWIPLLISRILLLDVLPILGSITSSMLGTGVGSSMSFVKSSSGSSSCCPRLLLRTHTHTHTHTHTQTKIIQRLHT